LFVDSIRGLNRVVTLTPRASQPSGISSRLYIQAMNQPNKTALICGETSVDYKTLDRTVTQMAQWLLRKGLKPGDRVGMLWFNEITAVVLYFACFRAGLIAMPVISKIKPPELRYIFEHAQPAIFFAHPKLMGVALEAQTNCAHRCPIFDSLPTDMTGAGQEFPSIDEKDPALIMYTSGTTARPKGVTHTHQTLDASMEIMWSLGRHDVTITTTSIMHPSGLFCVTLATLLSGGTLVLVPAFDAATTLDLIEKHRCTYGFLLPSMAQQLIAEQIKKPRKTDSLEWIIAGGDTVPVTTQTQFKALLGVPLSEGIGMTESCPMLVNPRHAIRSGSVGVCWGAIEARVVDSKGEVVANGEIGELTVRSPANCVGYWKNPSETDAAIRDGWLFTGDLVRRDSDGYFWFQGRKKQIIVRESYNVSPQEVEEVLYKHPAVFEAGVYGLPDATYGEKVIAAVSLRSGQTADEEQLREFSRKHLNDLKVPERIHFLTELPKGLSGKVDRRALKEMAQIAVDRAKSLT
jgi:long-chain acyl-CoA synthetase